MRHVSRGHHVSLRRQLAAGLEAAIRDGHIRPGSALPSTRDMAARTGLHRSTVTAAYARLRSRGWASGEEGGRFRASLPGVDRRRGPLGPSPGRSQATSVRPGACPRPSMTHARATEGLGRVLADARMSGLSRSEILAVLATLVADISEADQTGAVALFEPHPGLRAALTAELERGLALSVYPIRPARERFERDGRCHGPVLARAEILDALAARRFPGFLDSIPLRLSGGTRERGHVRRIARTGLVTLVSVSRLVRDFAEELAAREFERGVSFIALHPGDSARLLRAISASRLVLYDEPSRDALPPTRTPAHPIQLLSPARIASLRTYLGLPAEVRRGT